MTLAGAEYSDILEVNVECTKVRRIEPLPKWLLCSPTSRLLLVWNISAEITEEDGAAQGLEHPSLSERIIQKFLGLRQHYFCLDPASWQWASQGAAALRQASQSQHLCAVVKFGHLQAVCKAYSALKAEEKSYGEGMCVVLLGFQPMHHFTEDEPSEKSKDQPGKSQENSFVTSEDSLQEEPSPPAEAPDKAPDASQSSDHSRQRTSEQISTSCCDQCFSGLYQKHSRMSWCSGGCVTDHSQSPWVLRCKLSAGALNPKMAGHLNAPC